MSLQAKFSTRKANVRQDGKTVEALVEWVEISGFLAGDAVSRRARPADIQRFKYEYAEFKRPQRGAEQGRGAAALMHGLATDAAATIRALTREPKPKRG